MFKVTLEDLLEAGVHFGHQVRRWNPKMAPYIYTTNAGVHVFDLTKTREALLEAYEAVRQTVEKGGIILFVATKRQAKEQVTQAAQKVGMPYLTTRWLGGTLTNFDQIRRSIKKLEELKKERAEGIYDSYTKKERLLIDREIGALERTFGGIVSLQKLPDIVFILDTHEEKTAVREAHLKGIPIVGVVDTNADPDIIDYPIPANDDALKSISLIVEVITQAVLEGQGKEGSESERVSDSGKKGKKSAEKSKEVS